MIRWLVCMLAEVTHEARASVDGWYRLGARDYRIGVSLPEEPAGDPNGKAYRDGWRREAELNPR